MNSQESFLQIVRLGIGHSADRISGEINWEGIQALAERQGLSGVIVDGVEKLPLEQRPPKPVLLQWIGEVLQGYEYRYELYRRALAEMAEFYNSHGYKMMILKGYACGLNWPKSAHRPYGDIDIWQFGQQREADDLLVKEKRIIINNRHHHHSVFYWRDFMVENHYDFINVHHHKSNVDLEKIFKGLGSDDAHFDDVYGEKVYLPSPNLHALFLLKHTMNDFTSFSMTLRQILDWAFLVEKHGKEIDWEWLIGMFEKYHMLDFFYIVNAICVEDLGFSASLFPAVQSQPELKERVLKDILCPKYRVEEPARLLPRLIYKYKRWRGNAWKHRMCYNESMWSAFWYGVWGHLLKPESI